jgi:hypothetical protein
MLDQPQAYEVAQEPARHLRGQYARYWRLYESSYYYRQCEAPQEFLEAEGYAEGQDGYHVYYRLCILGRFTCLLARTAVAR